MLFFSRTGREIERSHVAAIAAVAELESPKFIDLDAVAVLVLKRTEKRPRRRIESVDAGISLAEVTHEQRAPEDSEAGGSDNRAPRRIKWSIVDSEPQIAHSVSTKLADVAVADTCQLIAGYGIHLGIHDVERATEVLNIEWMISVSHGRRDSRIDEATGSGCQCVRTVIDINVAITKVCGVQPVPATVRTNGQTLITAACMTRA